MDPEIQTIWEALKCCTGHSMTKQKHHTATFKAQVTWELLKEEKTVTQIAAEHGIHPDQLHRWKRQALDNFAHLFTESQDLQRQAREHDEQLAELYAQIGKLTTQLEWLKKNLASTLSRDERRRLLDTGPDTLPLTLQTTLLGVNRSSLYYRPVGPDPEELALKHRIDELYRTWTSELARVRLSLTRITTCRSHMGTVAPATGDVLGEQYAESTAETFLRFLEGAKTEIQSRLCRLPGDPKKT